jgi:hypothetical protein
VVLERALDETVDRIERATIARLAAADVRTGLSGQAKSQLKERYKPTYIKALKNGRKWEEDRHRVLLRADQVGYVAALALLFCSVVLELRRAGVGEKPGQEIEVSPVDLPEVNASLIEAAAKVIDCQKPSNPQPDQILWDWCTRSGSVSFNSFMQQAMSSLTTAKASEIEQAILERRPPRRHSK